MPPSSPLTPADTQSQWHDARRREAIDYLDRHGVKHGRVGEVPAWQLYPYLAVWAVESRTSPEWGGWWVIRGDGPTDYVTCTRDRTPRSAVETIAARWHEASSLLARGEQHPDFSVGDPSRASELAPLLEARARTLLQWAAD